jgi:hypothetical protein
MPLVLKMATPQQRSWCVLQLAKKQSETAVQCAFRTQFHMEPPSRVSTYAWYKKFDQKGCICKGKSPGRPSVSDTTVDCVWACFQCSPWKSTHWASHELRLPQITASLPHGCSEPPECAPSPEMNQSCRSQWHRGVQMTAEIARLNSVRLLVGLHKRQSICSTSAMIFARVEAANHNCHSFRH